MRRTLISILLTIVYCVIGIAIAYPISYYFQSDIFAEMSLRDYLRGGEALILDTLYFGSAEVIRATSIGCVIACVSIGKVIEWRLTKHR